MVDSPSWSSQPTSPFELRHASTDRPFFVRVPPRRVLMIEGTGPRKADDFETATRILRKVDEVVLSRLRHDAFRRPAPPILEVVSVVPAGIDRDHIAALLETGSNLRWAQMLELPIGATDALAREAIDRTRREGGRELPLVHIVEYHEGPAFQLLRTTASDRIPSILRLLDAITAMGHHAEGRIHELLLSDPSRVTPDRARAIVRLPIIH